MRLSILQGIACVVFGVLEWLVIKIGERIRR